MLKSSVIIICVLFVAIKCGIVANNEQDKETFIFDAGSAPAPEDSIPEISWEMNQDEKSEPIPTVDKYPIIQSSNVVNNDGSFSFSSNTNGILIEVTGYLVDINGTQKLELQGKYFFGNKSIWFYANKHGFTEVEPPQHIPARVVGTILG